MRPAVPPATGVSALAAKGDLWSPVPFPQQDRLPDVQTSLLSFFQLSQAARLEEEAQMPNADKHKVRVRDPKAGHTLWGCGSSRFLPNVLAPRPLRSGRGLPISPTPAVDLGTFV